MADWGAEVDKMIRLDKRTPERIEAVIRFSQADSFWCSNILSMSKLRKQFDQLELKMKSAKQPEAERLQAEKEKAAFERQERIRIDKTLSALYEDKSSVK